MYFFTKATTNATIYVRLRDSATGLAKTGLVYNSAGAACYYTRPLAAAAQLTLATQTVTGAHTDGGFIEVDSTNAKGLYRLDLSDAVCATGVDYVIVSIEFDGIIEEAVEIVLPDNTAKDIYDIVNHVSHGNAQLTRSTTPANTLDIEADGMAHADLKEWLGVAPNVMIAGRPDVQIGAYDTGIGPQDLILTTPANKITTESDGMVHSDLKEWLGTAVTTSSTSAKPEVDVFSISDDATASNNAELDYDGTGYAKANSTMGTVTTLTGHTAQTGDSYPIVSTLKVKKNTALTNFPFVLLDSNDHFTPIASRTVTAQRSIDGAALGACANAVAEVSNGIYKIDLDAADLNGDTIILRFTASGADDRLVTVATQP